jgi:hypothetical protein
MIQHHGKEAGRHDTGTDESEAERPTPLHGTGQAWIPKKARTRREATGRQ